jgi:hypothetical protein
LENGIDVDNEFSGAGHDGAGVVFTIVAQSFVEVGELGVPFDGGLGAGEERGSGSCPATLDMAFALEPSRLSYEGCNAQEACGLLAAEASELWHADDDGDGGAHANAVDTLHEIKIAREVSMMTDRRFDELELFAAQPQEPFDLGLVVGGGALTHGTLAPGFGAGNIFLDLLNHGQMAGKIT